MYITLQNLKGKFGDNEPKVSSMQNLAHVVTIHQVSIPPEFVLYDTTISNTIYLHTSSMAVSLVSCNSESASNLTI